jgi:hypothetical protein
MGSTIFADSGKAGIPHYFIEYREPKDPSPA